MASARKEIRRLRGQTTLQTQKLLQWLLLLQKLKTESENLMSGVIEPAAFVIRTGMTSRDIRGANKEDWIRY